MFWRHSEGALYLVHIVVIGYIRRRLLDHQNVCQIRRVLSAAVLVHQRGVPVFLCLQRLQLLRLRRLRGVVV